MRARAIPCTTPNGSFGIGSGSHWREAWNIAERAKQLQRESPGADPEAILMEAVRLHKLEKSPPAQDTPGQMSLF